MPCPSPAEPLVRAKIRSYGALWMPVFQVFSPSMCQTSPRRAARVSMCVASEPCSGSVMPNAKPVLPSRSGCDELRLLLVRAVREHEQHADVVRDDRVLVLEIAVEPEPLRRQVLADDRHAEVRAVAAAVRLRQRIAIEPGVVGHLPDRGEERLPLLVRQPAAVPVGARVFAPVVEEADVVVAPRAARARAR